MKYVIDKKKNKETVYSMLPECERCFYEYSGIIPPDCNEECYWYNRGGLSYKEISSGKIGMDFLEFISNDFEKIRDELVFIWHTSEHYGTECALESLDEYLKYKPYYLKLLNLGDSFCFYIEHAGRIPDFESIEMSVESTFEQLIAIKKIISAYADDKYFVEPTVLLQAIDEFRLMYIPSVHVPEYRDEYKALMANPIDMIKNFAEDCKKSRGNVYEFYDFRQMFGVALDWIVSNNYKISRCENCGKFFVPYGRYDAKYCEYPFKNGKSCRELSFSINVDNNAVLKEYRKIYKTKHAWTKRNKVTQPGVETDFERWHKNAKAIVDKYKLGAVSEMEALKWLEDNK